jgi:hypothetical protein
MCSVLFGAMFLSFFLSVSISKMVQFIEFKCFIIIIIIIF